MVVLADVALHQLKAFEGIGILLETGRLLLAQLLHEHALPHIYIVLIYPLHNKGKLALINIQRGAELRGIKGLRHVAGRYHQVINDRVGEHVLALTVGDHPAWRIYYLFIDSYIIGHDLILRLKIL